MAVFVIKPKQRGDDASSLYFFQCSLLFKIRKIYKKVEISDEIRICSRKHEIRTNFIHQRKTAIIKTFWGNVNLFDWKFRYDIFSCLSSLKISGYYPPVFDVGPFISSYGWESEINPKKNSNLAYRVILSFQRTTV